MNNFPKSLTKNVSVFFFVLISIVLLSCNKSVDTDKLYSEAKGKLFIIGGGYKPDYLIDSLIAIANLSDSGYVVVLPMSSQSPDTASLLATQMFNKHNITKVYTVNVDSVFSVTDSVLNLIGSASLIYIPGGDQTRFMKSIQFTKIKQIIQQAYHNGTVIAGTSAGAAVMSERMITGNQSRQTKYTGDFTTIESLNIEIDSGLALMKTAIIDQHFVKRMRMNRLIAVSLENPDSYCIGIDESTAICVDNNNVRIIGESQVIVLKHTDTVTTIKNGLLGGKKLELNVFLPGDTFLLIQ